MSNYIIEKDFKVDDYRCLILGLNLGHRCGYIGLPVGHKYYGKGYEDVEVDIHGGWTYASDSDHFMVESDLWWIGFDCAHYGDGKDLELIKSFGKNESLKHLLYMEEMFPSGDDFKSLEFVESELRHAVKDLQNLRI